jgi:hypothetical protein
MIFFLFFVASDFDLLIILLEVFCFVLFFYICKVDKESADFVNMVVAILFFLDLFVCCFLL